jgi:DNA polymerase-4
LTEVFGIHEFVSARLEKVFAGFPLSLDEAYLDVTDNPQDIPFARDIALQVRAKIKSETGLNASAGISYNKFLAKLAPPTRY